MTNFHALVRTVLRDRVLDAGAEIICADGWQGVTMSRVAKRVGVSRQMVYKEVGSKEALGEAIISRHADRFLEGVAQHLLAHGANAPAGVAAAVEYTLRTAAEDPLLKAVLSSAHGASEDLLPLLTTRPEPVLDRAISAVLGQVRALYADLGLGDERLASMVEMVVRLTLSHLAQPSGPVEHAVEQVRWLVECVIGQAE
jgi:AcrR family transcriptional regulator